MTSPQPGDIGLCTINGPVGRLIQFGEWANGDGFGQYEHAYIVTHPETPEHPGRIQAIAAFPGGATHALYPAKGPLYSTGAIPLTDTQRTAIVAAAEHYLGTPYSWLDYLAIAAHRTHIPLPGLRRYIASTRHMICSQLVDQCYADAGIQLFPGLWDGYCTPAMLAHYIEERAGT